MTSALIVELLAALARVVPEVIDALRPEVAGEVRAMLARSRAMLPPAGSVAEAVEDAIARNPPSAPYVPPVLGVFTDEEDGS